MPDIITSEERAAIAAYRGPVTKCPPRTFSIDAACGVHWRVIDQTKYRRAKAMEEYNRKREAKSRETVKKLRQCQAKGMTRMDAAAFVGVSYTRACELVAKHKINWPSPPTGKNVLFATKAERDAAILDLWQQGHSRQQISLMARAGWRTVDRLVREAGEAK